MRSSRTGRSPRQFGAWYILQREYDGGQLKRAKQSDTRAKVAVSGARMDFVPELFQPLRNRSNAHREASEISIQDRQPRPYDEQPQVAGALPQRRDRFDLTRQIDTGSIEPFSVFGRKERARKHPFRLGEEVHVFRITRQVAV